MKILKLKTKLEAAFEYLNSNEDSRTIARKHKMSAAAVLKFIDRTREKEKIKTTIELLNYFKNQLEIVSEEEFEIKQKRQYFSQTFKEAVLIEFLETNADLKEICKKYNIKNAHTSIPNWKSKIMLENGFQNSDALLRFLKATMQMRVDKELALQKNEENLRDEEIEKLIVDRDRLAAENAGREVDLDCYKMLHAELKVLVEKFEFLC